MAIAVADAQSILEQQKQALTPELQARKTFSSNHLLANRCGFLW
ncbi:hypothetical protein O9993_00205 [Vibrio lentus]|nr:hypothetical protein [Vibrio lentus]